MRKLTKYKLDLKLITIIILGSVLLGCGSRSGVIKYEHGYEYHEINEYTSAPNGLYRMANFGYVEIEVRNGKIIISGAGDAGDGRKKSFECYGFVYNKENEPRFTTYTIMPDNKIWVDDYVVINAGERSVLINKSSLVYAAEKSFQCNPNWREIAEKLKSMTDIEYNGLMLYYPIRTGR